MKKWLSVSCIFLIASVAQSQSLDHLRLIAHYPFDSDAIDVTGLQNPMELVNAPFQDGGVFLNGVYIGSGDSNASGAVTPQLNGMSFGALAVSLDFKVTESYSFSRPLLVCGNSWRWMSVWLEPDSTLRFYVNDLAEDKTLAKVSLNATHNITMTYDSTQSMCKLYFNGNVLNSVNAVLDHNNDANFASSHGGGSDAFKGIWNDLKIYSQKTTTAVQSEGQTPTQFALVQNYPNPFNPTTVIRYQLPQKTHVTLRVLNLLGQEVRTLVDSEELTGFYAVNWDGKDRHGQLVAAGVYLYWLKAGDQTAVKKMLLIK